MKEQLKRLGHFIFLISCFFTLQACGGGGGSSSTPGTSTPNTSTNYTIATDITSVSSTSIVSQTSNDTFEIQVTFNGEGLLLGLAPNNEVVPWAEYSISNLTDTSATITVEITNTNTLAAAIYNNTLRLTTGNTTTQEFVHQDIAVELEVWGTNTSEVNFADTLGNNDITAQTLEITSAAVDWVLTTDVDWLTIDNTSGNANSTISLSIDTTQVNTGALYTGNIVLAENITGGDNITIPVSLALDSIRLDSNFSAVSLYQLADQAKLTDTVSITDNSLLNVSWQAASNVDWLDITSDTTANTLTMSKNANVIADGQHFAEITITSVTANQATTHTINVGYYQSSDNAATVDLTDFDITSIRSIAFDPLRPLAYTIGNSEIISHNLFTGAVVDNISTPISLTNLAIAPSGDYLLASAVTNVADNIFSVYRINLSDNTVTEISLPTSNAIVALPHFISRVDGKDVIVTQALEFATDDLTRQFWDTSASFVLSIVQQAENTNTITVLQTTPNILTPDVDVEPTFISYDLSFNEFTNNKVTATQTRSFTTATYTDAAPLFFDIDNSGDTIYTAQNSSEWLNFDGNNYIENGVLYTTENTSSIDVKVDNDNNSYFSRARILSDSSAVLSLTKYNDMQVEQWSQDITNGSDSSFIVPELRRFITLNPSTTTWFITSFPE